jgi:hypothetical protein
LVQRRRKFLISMKGFKPDTYHNALTGLQLKPPKVWKYQYKNNKRVRGKGRKAKYVSQCAPRPPITCSVFSLA